MSTLNWNAFKNKYDQKETSAFENLSYLLFCSEFENRIGLFRYKNQTGIETEPIEKDGETYGFQAKYYTVPISGKKSEITGSIKKTKRENPIVNKVYFYLNQEFSESTKKGQKKPKYQIEIENTAKTLGVEIIWRVPSYFEIQLLQPENKYIHDLFFISNPNAGDLIDELKKHTESILNPIKTEIIFNEQKIKIDRTNEIGKIENLLKNNTHLIINGEGGCGKTAIIKDFCGSNSDFPICIFKANQLNIFNINDLFRFSHNFSFAQFIDAYKSEANKLFIIDSAEKLAELVNTDVLQQLIQSLKNEKWTIVFTTRECYLSDLKFHIKHSYQLPCEVESISHISDETLRALSVDYNFKLPDNSKFKDRIKNLFYLSEYLGEYDNIDTTGNFKTFVDLIWKKRIQGTVRNNNLDLVRGDCFMDIARKRCDTGLFYINTKELPQHAVFALELDDIINREDKGHFITHDIYEEWALDKIISQAFSSELSTIDFFNKIGASLPMRRAFRLWLSEQISENIDEVQEFINDSFTNNQIPQFWKDELIVSVLLSDYSKTFFTRFEKELIAENFNILNRILFLLRIACTEIDNSINAELSDYLFTKPKGEGWKATIEFIYEHKEAYLDDHLKLVLPVLTEWVKHNKEGNATRYAGLLALDIINKRIEAEHPYIDKETRKIIFKIIYNSARELKEELKQIFEQVIANNWIRHSDPYNELCTNFLEKPYLAKEIIKELPFLVIEICDLFWKGHPVEDIRFHRDSMETKYGLCERYEFKCSPASAYQTPIYWLLKNSFYETVDFIIQFVNYSVNKYKDSDFGKEDVEEIELHLKAGDIKQYSCWTFWGMYRGISNPAVPYLLQSIHMAFEKILLELADFLEPKITEQILTSILLKSQSVSLTAVVCSVVLAYPHKLSNVALIIFKTIDFFGLDTIRSTNEFQAKSLYSIGSLSRDEFYSKERLKTCEDKHRSFNLESLCVNYQFNGIAGASEEENSELISQIYAIIDQHKKELETSLQEKKINFGILLARMDRRNMNPTVKKYDDSSYLIELNPKLSQEQKELSEKATEKFEDFHKFTAVKLWSLYKCEGNPEINKFQKYEDDPLLALKEVKELIQDASSGRRKLQPLDDTIPATVCAALIRFYSSMLSSEDIEFCKEIIVDQIIRIFNDEYHYQLADGVEESVKAIPKLMHLFKDEASVYLRILLYVLFDDYEVGNKRVCDYAIETIHQEKLWDNSFVEVKSLLYAFINLKPRFNKYFEEIKNSKSYQFGIALAYKEEVLGKIEEEIENLDFNDFTVSEDDLMALSIADSEIIFQLIPNGTQREELLPLIDWLIPKVVDLLSSRKSDDELFSIRTRIFKKFAYFILNTEVQLVDEIIIPILNSLSGDEETEDLLSELISTEDNQKKTEVFWIIWQMFYNPIIKKRLIGFHAQEVVKTYLLAWQWWRKETTDWHSLNETNLWLYENAASDLGYNPAVLYSIVKVLNSIGSKFVNQGIKWIYTIVSTNKDLELNNLEENTLFYMERLMRKFIFLNKEKIKREIRLKSQVIPILDFMIERGSVHGYLLRESVL